MEVGRSIQRVDAVDKVTGRAQYTDDLCPRNALVAKVLHSTIANGVVKSMDLSEAQAIPGVVKVLTCFDVPDIPFPTAGHPWSMDPSHQDIADRHLLNRHVRYYGDDVAVARLDARFLPRFHHGSGSDLSNVISLADDGCAHAAHDSSDRSHLDLLFIL